MLARPLPWFRAGGGYLVPLFAAQSRHEEPYPPMSKINIPFKMPFTRNVEKYTPFPRRFQAGNAVSGNCAGRLARRARPTRCGAQSDCPLIRPRQARPLPLYASAVSSVRGTSIIRKRVAAVPFVTPRRAGGGLCARWATLRPPAAGTSPAGRGESVRNRWRDIANRMACQFLD